MEELSIIKIGGSVIDDEKLLQEFLGKFSRIPQKKILIHGGGLIASRLSEKLGIEVQMHQGRRITDRDSLDIVTMVYGGLINKTIVAKLHALSCPAIGLTGADGGLIQAKRRPAQPIDYGFVGDIEKISAKFLKQTLDQGLTPVIAPLSCSSDGQLLNTNADTIASELCQVLTPHYHCSLLYAMDHAGVLLNPDDPQSAIAELDRQRFAELIESRVISKGMIPKLENALKAKAAGAAMVKICDAASSIAICHGSRNLGTELV
ncbi:MAG: acetylglutamate kinase [Oligoflexus sp.]